MEKFEQTLSKLNRSPLPGEWKEGLLDVALSPGNPTKRTSWIFGKLGIGAIVLCWVVTGCLVLTTPKIHDSSPLVFAAEEDFSMVVAHLASRGSLSLNERD